MEKNMLLLAALKPYLQSIRVRHALLSLVVGGLAAASMLAHGQTYTVPLIPKYQVMGVVYAPPGSASSVTYGNAVAVGSANSFLAANNTMYTQSTTTTSGFSLSIGPFSFGSTSSNTSTSGWGIANQNAATTSIQTTQGNSVATAGPVSSALGVNHDNDIIYIWLNPMVMTTTTTTSGKIPLTWTGLNFNSCDLTDTGDQLNFYQAMNGCDPNQFPFPDIVGIPVWCLKNPYYPGSSCAQWLAYTSRTWDVNTWGTGNGLPLGPGLTLQDYADILSADPFVTQTLVATNTTPNYYCHSLYGVNFDPNDQETIFATPGTTPPSGQAWPTNFCVPNNPNNYPQITMQRFDALDSVQYPEPGINGEAQTYSGNFSYSKSTGNSTNATYTSMGGTATNATNSFGYTAAVPVPLPGGLVTQVSLGLSFSISNGTGQTWSNAQTYSSTSNSSTSNTAGYSITGPQVSDNYTGPTTFNVYKDNVFGTFAFYSDLQTLQPPILLVSAAAPAGSAPISVSSSATSVIALPNFGTVQVGTMSPSIQKVYLTNNSGSFMTMVAPTVTFSNPGFQVIENNTQYPDWCSNTQLAPYGSSGVNVLNNNLPIYQCSVYAQFSPVASDTPNTYTSNSAITANLIAAGTENIPVYYQSTPYYENILVSSTGVTVSGTASPVSSTGCSVATINSNVYPQCNVGATLVPASPVSGQPNGYTFPQSSYTAEYEQFTFTNYYSSPVLFGANPVDVAVSEVTDFSVPNTTQNPDHCSGTTVQPGQTCTFYLKFLPQGGLSAMGTRLTAVGSVQWPTGASSPIPLAMAGADGTALYVTLTGSVGCLYELTKNSDYGCGQATLKNSTSYSLTITSDTGTNTDYLPFSGTIAAGGSSTVTSSSGEGCVPPANSTCGFSGTATVSGTLSNGATFSGTLSGGGGVCSGTACPPVHALQISGSEQSKQVTKSATYAKGNVSVTGAVKTSFAGTRKISLTIGGFTAAASYTSTANNITVAKALAAAANVSGSPVIATVSGDTIGLISKIAGTAGNMAYAATNNKDFTITPGSSSLSGGANAVSTTDYDAGSVNAAVGNVAASATWGKPGTSDTIATALAASLNTAAQGAFTATASGGVVTLTPASGTTLPSVSVSVKDGAGFNPASFTATSN